MFSMNPEEKADAARVGKRLRRHRQSAELTIRELAEKLDVSYQMIQKYESGKSRISLSRLTKAAEILGLSIGDFVAESGGILSTEPRLDPAGRRLGDQEQRLLNAFNRLSEKAQRRAVLELVETMAFKSPSD